MDVYIARQPIFDSDYNVIAYELLYRDSLENVFKGNISDNVATSLLLVNSYFNFGIDRLIDETRAFINFDKHLIMHGIPELLNKDAVTIEILETVKPDYKFLKKLEALKKQGYSIALDDYDVHYKYPELLDYVDLVKVDFTSSTTNELKSLVESLKKRPVTLLAEKVETKEEFEWAKSVGFTYFQGYFFERPSVQTKKSMNQSGLNYVRLMGELNNPEPDFHKLSKIIMVDVSLTYKLLKLANSNMKPVNDISSIQQGLAVLGVKKFKRWLSLVMVENMSSRETNEAIKYALIRSSLLQSIAKHSNLKKDEDELSLLGILSILDVMLEMNMVDILESLPISEEMKLALLGQPSKYSDALKLCYAYEKGVFNEVEIAAKHIVYPLDQLPEHYVAAISWAEKTYRMLKEES